MESQKGPNRVIKKMMDVTGVTSVDKLSRYFGHRSNAIQNKLSRGKYPFYEAFICAEQTGVSLDWLLLDRGERTYSPESSEEPDPIDKLTYLRASRAGALPANCSAADDAAWAAQNRRAQDVLREVVEGVETALNEAKLTLAPGKKAELVSTLFEIYAAAHAQPSRDHILRLVRSAS